MIAVAIVAPGNMNADITGDIPIGITIIVIGMITTATVTESKSVIGF